MGLRFWSRQLLVLGLGLVSALAVGTVLRYGLPFVVANTARPLHHLVGWILFG